MLCSAHPYSPTVTIVQSLDFAIPAIFYPSTLYIIPTTLNSKYKKTFQYVDFTQEFLTTFLRCCKKQRTGPNRVLNHEFKGQPRESSSKGQITLYEATFFIHLEKAQSRIDTRGFPDM